MAADRCHRPRCRRAHGATRCRRCCRSLAAGCRLWACSAQAVGRCSSTAVAHGLLDNRSTATFFTTFIRRHIERPGLSAVGNKHHCLPGGGCAVASSCSSRAKRPLRCARADTRCRASSSAGVRANQPSSGTDSAALRTECPTDTSSGRTCSNTRHAVSLPSQRKQSGLHAHSIF